MSWRGGSASPLLLIGMSAMVTVKFGCDTFWHYRGLVIWPLLVVFCFFFVGGRGLTTPERTHSKVGGTILAALFLKNNAEGGGASAMYDL